LGVRQEKVERCTGEVQVVEKVSISAVRWIYFRVGRFLPEGGKKRFFPW